jgi:hypothetical protein
MYNKQARLGRNDICQCGSGKKYKKCCLLNEVTTIEIIDNEWKKLRQMEGTLIDNDLSHFLEQNIPATEAWEAAISCFADKNDWSDEQFALLIDQAFLPWFFFNWIPSTSKPKKNKDKFSKSNKPIALQYLERYSNSISSFKRQVIEEMCESHYSFYQILDAVPGLSIKFKDIFLQTEHMVKERSASNMVKKGDIIYTRIITINKTSICSGMVPFVIPASNYGYLLEQCDALKEIMGGKLTVASLNILETYMRGMCFNIISKQLNSQTHIQNTDGEDFEFCSVSFELAVSPREAFDGLMPLTLDQDAEYFLSDAQMTKDGKLKKVEFPWQKAGNNKHKNWSNTVLGTVIIENDNLTIEVNSRVRAEKAIQLVGKYLGNGAAYKKTTVQSIEEARRQTLKKKPGEKEDNFMELPEIQEELKEMIKSHWETWFDTPLPMLNDMTPKKAAKTKKGKELLEALLLSYEGDSSEQNNGFLIAPVAELRKKLGLYD